MLSQESPIFSRCINRSLPAAAPTTLLFFTFGGMGDRVCFQGIVADALRRSNRAYHRVIAVIPFHAGEYDAHAYKPCPDEIWVVPLWERTPAFIATLLCAARNLFPRTAELDIISYGNHCDGLISRPPEIRYLDFYSSLKLLAVAGHYPAFALSADSLWRLWLDLARAGIDRTRPLIALHCRQHCPLTPGEEAKNPRIADMVKLARFLRERLDACIISIAGNEELPGELGALSEFRPLSEPTLQTGAAAIACADLFIGGDSGPVHLAAAVGTPLFSIRPRVDKWLYGPFAPTDRVEYLEGSIFEKHEAGVAFDAEEAFQAICRLLKRGAARPSAVTPADGKRTDYSGLMESFAWEELFYLADLLEAGGQREITFGGPGLPTEPRMPAFLMYFLERGFNVEIRIEPGMVNFPLLDTATIPRYAKQLSVIYPVSVGASEPSPEGDFFLRRFGPLVVPEFRLSATSDDPVDVIGRIARYGVKPRCRLTVEADAAFTAIRKNRAVADQILASARACRTMGMSFELVCGAAPVHFTPGELGRLVKLAGGSNPFVRSAGIVIGPGLQFRPMPAAAIPAGSLYSFATLQELVKGCLDPLYEWYSGHEGGLPCGCPGCSGTPSAHPQVFTWIGCRPGSMAGELRAEKGSN